MAIRFHGTLRGNGLSARCIYVVNEAGADHLSDDEVDPQLPDGEYDLEANGVHKRATRAGGVWTGEDY
jgi:hypothetical protein